MKWPLFILILTLFSCAQMPSRTPSDKALERHMVFDIDWTIVSEIKNPSLKDLQNKRVIEIEGLHYFIADGLEEFIGKISHHKEIKISFYSGGQESRNISLLKKIKLKNGKSLFDISYKVLSKKDLVPVPNAPAEARFAERFKKDLTKISKDLGQLIMLDDTANFVLEGSDNQNEHVFYLGKAFLHFEKFSDTEGLTGDYIPKSYDQWRLHKNKLIIMSAVFEEAYTESDASGIPFSETMKKYEELLNLKDNEWNNHSKRLYNKILQIPAANGKPAGQDCFSVMSPFLI